MDAGAGVSTGAGGTALADVTAWRTCLTRWTGGSGSEPQPGDPADVCGARELDQVGRIELVAALEQLKAAAAALQAQLSVDFDACERERQRDAGVPREGRGRGVAVQLGMARRESPHRAAVLLGAAKALCAELPCTFAALADGRLSEYRATLIVQETACLAADERAAVDRTLCADPAVLDGVGTRRLVAMAREHAYRADPAAFVRRAAHAENERSVTLRPAPDTMTYLTALLPVAQGVAAYAALRREADSARASGDGRGRGQVMADTLVERLTGQAAAAAVPVSVSLVMSDADLLASGHGAAVLDGYGTVPAQVARTLVANGLDAEAAWLRRVYTDPRGRVVAGSSRERFHPEGLASLLRVRDQGTCRMPYCDAPVRHLDHVVPAELGGPTDAENGQGLCEACNHAKQAPGWRQEVAESAVRHTVVTTTPSGHVYRSVAPHPPPPLRRSAPAPTWDPPRRSDRPPDRSDSAQTRGGIDAAFARFLGVAA